MLRTLLTGGLLAALLSERFSFFRSPSVLIQEEPTGWNSDRIVFGLSGWLYALLIFRSERLRMVT